MRIVPRFDPIKLGGASLVALSLPLPLLAFDLPVAAIVAVLAVSSFFGPLVNAPLIGVITTRTPAALRAKVMTAVLTVAMLAGPLGLLVAGPLLESQGPHRVLLIVAAGQFLAAMPFASLAFRRAAAAPAAAT